MKRIHIWRVVLSVFIGGWSGRSVLLLAGLTMTHEATHPSPEAILPLNRSHQRNDRIQRSLVAKNTSSTALNNTSQNKIKRMQNDTKPPALSTLCTRCQPDGLLFTWIRKDRSGAALEEMLRAHAVAGGHYGGACGQTEQRPAHQELVSFLGLEKELSFECNVTHTTQGCVLANAFKWNCLFSESVQQIMEGDWKESLQKQVYQSVPPPSLPTGTNYTIVVHIRRGDVTPCSRFWKRYLPNEHFLTLIDRELQKRPERGCKYSVNQTPMNQWTSFETDSMK